VVPVHLVPRAKFPAVDIHGHPPALVSDSIINRVGAGMDALNLQVMVSANGTSGDRLVQQLAAIKASRYKDRFVMFTTLNLRDVGPGSGAKIAAQLEADVKAGAVGIGELMKSFGMTNKKADGTRLMLDDPELDIVWETAARLKIPVFVHTADPAEFWAPLDFHNERWLEQAIYPERRYQDSTRFPSFEELMAERDRMLKKHPNTRWVLAHLGWHAQDLARLGRMFDSMPNLYAEVGAVLYDIGRQPRNAHDFFVKYQDRLLFGKDSYQPDEYPYYWRVFETNDEYFDYYRDYHAFWKLYGIGLPDVVLKKLYYGNALKIIPGLPRTGFPK
jgi:predicted TIM-barrel fold metal-dependent hydrolase